jgi:hypothetical protein
MVGALKETDPARALGATVSLALIVGAENTTVAASTLVVTVSPVWIVGVGNETESARTLVVTIWSASMLTAGKLTDSVRSDRDTLQSASIVRLLNTTVPWIGLGPTSAGSRYGALEIWGVVFASQNIGLAMPGGKVKPKTVGAGPEPPGTIAVQMAEQRYGKPVTTWSPEDCFIHVRRPRLSTTLESWPGLTPLPPVLQDSMTTMRLPAGGVNDADVIVVAVVELTTAGELASSTRVPAALTSIRAIPRSGLELDGADAP